MTYVLCTTRSTRAYETTEGFQDNTVDGHTADPPVDDACDGDTEMARASVTSATEHDSQLLLTSQPQRSDSPGDEDEDGRKDGTGGSTL